MAADLAVGLGAEVGIVSVVPIRLGPPADDPWSDRSEHVAELHDAVRTLRARGLETTTHEPSGDPGPRIVQVAREFGYDMVVIGSRHLDPLPPSTAGECLDVRHSAYRRQRSHRARRVMPGGYSHGV